MDEQGYSLITQIKHVQERVFQKLLIQSNIRDFNSAQGRILNVLWQDDSPLPVSLIAQKTGLARNTLTCMLDRMENQKLLKRRPDAIDRRMVNVSLTPKARALQGDYQSITNQMSSIFYRGLSQAQIAAIESGLKQILENLNAYEQDGCMR